MSEGRRWRPTTAGARRGALAMLAAVAWTAGAAAIAGAQQDTVKKTSPHDAQPERPTVATHAGTVARGWIEIESGVERDRGPGDGRAVIGSLVTKIGLAPRVQFSIFTNVTAPGDVGAGFGDAAVGVKWRLLEDHPVLGDFAILPSVKFPTGSLDKGTGTGTTDASFLLISSRDVGPVHIDLNAGWTHRSGDGGDAPVNAWVWTASFGGVVDGPLGWTAEFYGYPGTGGAAGASPVVALLAGPTYAAKSWLVFDVGFITPIAGGQPRALYAGVTYNIGQVFR